jgi:hypothetical protein
MSERRTHEYLAAKSGDQEIDLVDIIDFLRINFLTWVVCLLIGMAGGFAIFSVLPYKWQADVTLQIGKVPVMQNFVYIDSPPQVVEKINSPLFLSKMLVLMYGRNVPSDSPTAALMYKDLKASLVKGNDLVNVHVFGWTADEAYKNAGILADAIIAEHRTMATPYLSGMQKRLAEVVHNIERNREVLTKVNAIEESAPAKTEANALLKVALIDAKATEIQKLKKEQTELEGTLSAATLQTTSIVGRSLVPRTPASPKLGLLLIGGGFIGWLFGLLLSFGLLIRRRRLGSPEGT